MKKLVLVAMAAVMLYSCSETDKNKNADGDEDVMVLQEDENINGEKMDHTNWKQVDFTSPVVKYDEVRSREIEVREKDSVSIFTIDEDILFEFDKAAIKDKGKEKLEEIAASIKKRYADGNIGIYGYTDSVGTEAYNQQLSKERADAVKQYLQQNTEIDMSRINTYGKGENDPTATNKTEAGRKKNRRVDIVAQKNN